VVANDPWQKSPLRPVTPAADRFALVKAAATGLDRVSASRLEIDRGGPSYTIDTVAELRAEASAAGRRAPEIFLVIGADLVETLPTWERVDELRDLVHLAVVARPGSTPVVPPGWDGRALFGEPVDVSSSQLRSRLAAGEAVSGVVPEAVIRCIRRRDLYAVRR
jgi:nicotinate-nucleotide adenylyltransferase